MSDASDRVIPATPRRREAARRQGAMPTAAVPAWVATAGTAVLLLPAWAAATAAPAADMLRLAIADAARPQADAPAIGGLSVSQLVAVSLPTMAVVLAAAAAGLGTRLLLDGCSWQPERALPMFRRIDPAAGLARIFSSRTVSGCLGGAAALAAVMAAGAIALQPLVAATATLPEATALAAMAWRSAAWLFAAAAAVAACRWFVARRRFERQIRMTPEEFADESKSAQADPKVRLLQRQRPRQPAAGAA